MCPMRGEDREERQHLFVHCGKVYRLWVRVAKMCELNFVGANNVGSNFDVWCHAHPKGPTEII